MEKKILDKNFFTTNWSNWQTESSTDIGTDNISSKGHTKVAQCPKMKKKVFFFKKNLFKKSSWIRGKQMWQICQLFLWQKKPLFLRSLSKNHWKNKQKLCQNKVMTSKWSFGLVESSVIILAEKKFERKLITFGWMSKNDVKKIFDKNFFTTNWSIDKQKAVLTTGPTNFRRNDIKSSLNAQCWNRKRTFSKKNSLQKISLDTW